MRSFSRALLNQFDHLYRHFPEADYFISTIRDRDSASAEQLRALLPKNRVEIDIVEAQPDLPIPLPPAVEDWTLGRMYGHEPYTISVHPQAILRQLWQLQRSWQYLHSKVYEGKASAPSDGSVEGYDLIIRTRPDHWFRSFYLPPQASSLAPGSARTPWWGRFGGINDRLALLGPVAAHAYFTTYSRIPELIAKGYPLHPERLIYASLIESGCQIDATLRAEFSKLIWDHGKDHGTFRDPEITSIDLAHLSANGGRP